MKSAFFLALLASIAAGCASNSKQANASATYLYVGSGYVYTPQRYHVSCRSGSLSVALPSGAVLEGSQASTALQNNDLQPVPADTSIAGQRIVAISGQRCQRGYARRHGYAPRLIAVVGGRGVGGVGARTSIGVGSRGGVGVSTGIGGRGGSVGGRVRLP